MSSEDFYRAPQADLAISDVPANAKWGMGRRNSTLVWIHSGMALIYLLTFGTIGFAAGMSGKEMTIFMLIIGTITVGLHTAAAIGASKGKAYGRRISRTLGILMLFGFPLGTLIGFLLLNNSGKKWQDDSENTNYW